MVRSLDIELEGCNVKGSCEDHPVKEWPVLENICDHLGSNLKEMVLHLSVCSTDDSFFNEWIEIFTVDMRPRGITSCIAWKKPDESLWLDYIWAASTSEGSLFNLMRKTVRGEKPGVRIWGEILRETDDAALSIPANVLEVLSGLVEGGMFYLELRHIKIKCLEGLEHLNNCLGIWLFHSPAVDDEEVATWNGLLAQVAMDPRPRNPERIVLPKVNTHNVLPNMQYPTAAFYDSIPQ